MGNWHSPRGGLRVIPSRNVCELCGWPTDDVTCCAAHNRTVCQDCVEQYEHPINVGNWVDGVIIPCGITWEPPSHDEIVNGLQSMERELR